MTPNTDPDDTASKVFLWSSSFLEGYSKYRPPYRQELYDIIYAYHQQHIDHWDTVHDAGTGNGLVALELSRRFKTIYASDPIESAITFLHQTFSSHPQSRNFHFAAHRAEEMATWIAPASLDMITIAESIHWTDPVAVLDAAARVLKPSGTLAIWNYGSRAFFPTNTDAEALFAELIGAHIVKSLKNRSEADNASFIMSTGLDTVAVDSRLFEREERWKWCAHKDFSPPGRQIAEWTPAYDRETEVHVSDDPTMWEMEVDYEWCKGFAASLHSSIEGAGQDHAEGWAELERMLEGKKTRVSFPATLILATRRGKVND